jgi:hypothetical protein
MGEEKILEWDDEEKVLRIRREPIRKIILEKASEFEEKCREELEKMGVKFKENIVKEEHIAFLTEYFARYIYDVLDKVFEGKGMEVLYSEKTRDPLINELNEVFEKKLREYLDSAAAKTIEAFYKVMSMVN